MRTKRGGGVEDEVRVCVSEGGAGWAHLRELDVFLGALHHTSFFLFVHALGAEALRAVEERVCGTFLRHLASGLRQGGGVILKIKPNDVATSLERAALCEFVGRCSI